jgi:transposase-like protein
MKPFKKTPNDLTLIQILEYFPTDEKAREHLESLRWPHGPVCPLCGIDNPLRIAKLRANPEKKVRAGLYNCKDCRRQFTVTTDSIFESSHIPLRKWLCAWYLLCTSKKGISSLQLQRMLDLGSYRTSLFMTHRIRFALKTDVFAEKLMGGREQPLEADETFVGGKPRHYTDKDGNAKTKVTKKVTVGVLLQRNGAARLQVLPDVTAKTLQDFVRMHATVTSPICTDEGRGYFGLQGKFDHHSVKHCNHEYARKIDDGFTAHTNTAESCFSLFKRGLMGTFHKVSAQHLPLYCAEFAHRWTHRKDSDGERTEAALRMAPGKRLYYRALVTKDAATGDDGGAA